jgi:hypothetical protein
MNIAFGLTHIIFLAVFATQVAIAAIAVWELYRLPRKFAQPLGSKVTIVELLQKYSRIFESISIRVDAEIRQPAKAYADVLLVNKRQVYGAHLYPSVYTLYQLLLMWPKYRKTLNVFQIQIVLVIAEVALFIAGLYFGEGFILIALLLGIILLIVSFIYQSFLSTLWKEVQDVAIDLLDLDKVEQARVKQLIRQMPAQAFVYAVEPMIWVIRFILPVS